MAEPLVVTPEAIVAATFALLDRRAAGRTICPSEVARALVGDADPAWRPLMPAIRETAAALVDAGRLRVTRGGVDVPARAPGGPIRLGRPLPPGARDEASVPSAPAPAPQAPLPALQQDSPARQKQPIAARRKAASTNDAAAGTPHERSSTCRR